MPVHGILFRKPINLSSIFQQSFCTKCLGLKLPYGKHMENDFVKWLSLFRQISCDVLLLFLYKTARFFGGKNWHALMEKRRKSITETNRQMSKEKKSLLLLLFWTLEKILTFFSVITFIFCISKKNIFLTYRSASFWLQKLLLTSELYLRELETCKHLRSVYTPYF